MKMYCVQASITRSVPAFGGFAQSTWSVPTFYLLPEVQGIVSSEHAHQVAKQIVDPHGQHLVELSIEDVRIR